VSTNSQDESRPTVVLVHGVFADASSWSGVIERLQAGGIRVTAPANPLRGISIDSAYINSFLEQVPGPVLAVGHSYGGAVITNAATNANNVFGLVYESSGTYMKPLAEVPLPLGRAAQPSSSAEPLNLELSLA
jgi:pimeloyl-ACP methyl ester carboxylesterase